MNGTDFKKVKKWLYLRDGIDFQKTLKNNDFPGDTTQKNDKIQKSSKNVKKHEKTREIEIQYIYI